MKVTWDFSHQKVNLDYFPRVSRIWSTICPSKLHSINWSEERHKHWLQQHHREWRWTSGHPLLLRPDLLHLPGQDCRQCQCSWSRWTSSSKTIQTKRPKHQNVLRQSLKLQNLTDSLHILLCPLQITQSVRLPGVSPSLDTDTHLDGLPLQHHRPRMYWNLNLSHHSSRSNLYLRP